MSTRPGYFPSQRSPPPLAGTKVYCLVTQVEVTCTRALSNGAQPGLKSATCELQVRCPANIATASPDWRCIVKTHWRILTNCEFVSVADSSCFFCFFFAFKYSFMNCKIWLVYFLTYWSVSQKYSIWWTICLSPSVSVISFLSAWHWQLRGTSLQNDNIWSKKFSRFHFSPALETHYYYKLFVTHHWQWLRSLCSWRPWYNADLMEQASLASPWQFRLWEQHTNINVLNYLF